MGGLMSRTTTDSPTSVLLFTQNIARHPIAWDPTQQRPTQEVIHAVHSALHFALDPCVDHPNEPLSFGMQDGLLVIPNREDLKQREGPKSGWEVNAKLFIYANGQKSGEYAKILERALAELQGVMGATTLESFVISLSNIGWHGEAVDTEGLDEVDKLGDLWALMSSRTELKSIGVSDFSSQHLQRLLSLVDSNPSLRKPSITQLNLPPSAAEPTELLELTQKEGINLQTHADDLGTTKQMVRLLSEFEGRLPLSPAFIKLRDQERYDEALPMEWILKYTVFNRDRGIVGEKGVALPTSPYRTPDNAPFRNILPSTIVGAEKGLKTSVLLHVLGSYEYKYGYPSIAIDSTNSNGRKRLSDDDNNEGARCAKRRNFGHTISYGESLTAHQQYIDPRDNVRRAWTSSVPAGPAPKAHVPLSIKVPERHTHSVSYSIEESPTSSQELHLMPHHQLYREHHSPNVLGSMSDWSFSPPSYPYGHNPLSQSTGVTRNVFHASSLDNARWYRESRQNSIAEYTYPNEDTLAPPRRYTDSPNSPLVSPFDFMESATRSYEEEQDIEYFEPGTARSLSPEPFSPSDWEGIPESVVSSSLADNPGKRRALIIALEYGGVDQRWNDNKSTPMFMKGPYSDGEDVYNLLLQQGYHEDEITFMTDEPGTPTRLRPTCSNIKYQLAQLIADANPGDRFFLYYAGHGIQVEDTDGDEFDGWDEAIIPADWATVYNYRDEGLIIDDYLKEVCVDVLPKGAHLTAVFDCCHAGTIMDLTYEHSTKGNGKFKLNELTGLLSRRLPSRYESVDGRVLCISACEDSQQAYARARGLLTEAFTRCIRESAKVYRLANATFRLNPTLKQLYEYILCHGRPDPEIYGRRYTQDPVLATTYKLSQFITLVRFFMMRSHIIPIFLTPFRSFQPSVAGIRYASTSSGSGTSSNQPYPFPTHTKSPTPFEIFHLPPSASSSDIKSRYYELVRSHHPDCIACRSLPRTVAHERFQAITHAYEVLTGKRKAGRGAATTAEAAEIARRRAAYRAAYASGRPYTGRRNEWGGFEYPDSAAYRERYSKGDITGNQAFYVAVSVIVVALLQATHLSPLLSSKPPTSISSVDRRHEQARLALEEARSRGQVYGDERREGIRKWVREAGLEGAGQNIGHGGRRRDSEDE
ncbi:Caspase domain, partial [Rhizoctonia solani]